MEEDKVQVSVNIPKSLWDRLADDARGVGQAIVDALDAHLPHAAQAPAATTVQVPATGTPTEATAPVADQPANVPIDPAPGAN